MPDQMQRIPRELAQVGEGQAQVQQDREKGQTR